MPALRRAYLDHNASAPLLDAARQAVIAALDVGGNPSSVHAEGRSVRALVEDARRAVAALAGARADHVTFTSGATEAASMLLTPDWTMGRAPLKASRLFVLDGDHACIASGGRFEPDTMVRIGLQPDGTADLARLSAALDAHDRDAGVPLVAVVLAHNETGVVQDVEAIAALVRRAGGILVADCVQAAGRLPLSQAMELADFLILSAHKLGGPKGVGAVVARSDLLMSRPMLRGGGQEKGHRAGTEAVALIAGFGAAARNASERLGDADLLAPRRDAIEARIAATVPGSIVVGQAAPKRLANTVFFTWPGMKIETALIAFDLEGIAISTGSACSSGKIARSRVLDAMGLKDEGAIRLSFGHSTSQTEIDAFFDVLDRIVARNRHSRARAA